MVGRQAANTNREAEVHAAEAYHVHGGLACRVGRRVLQRGRRGESGNSAGNITLTPLAPRRASATVARGRRRGTRPRSSHDQTLGEVGRAPSPRPPEIKRKCFPNESQRGPRATPWEAPIYEALFAGVSLCLL